jgi:hypothetical protein
LSTVYDSTLGSVMNRVIINIYIVYIIRDIMLIRFVFPLKVDRYSYHKNPAQESRTQNRVTIFTRRSRKLINKMKELPK